jgi:poly(hydroxyalkanoate) granule-associated protein
MMATRKKATKTRVNVANAKRSARRAQTKATAAGQQGRGAMQDAWKATLDVLGALEAEAQKQIRSLVKQGRVSTAEARAMVSDLSERAMRERRRATVQIESRVKDLQARMAQERKALGKVVDEAVRTGLASFNIPSRQEVSQLTRKVDELSRKIDGLKTRARRKTSARVRATA